MNAYRSYVLLGAIFVVGCNDSVGTGGAGGNGVTSTTGSKMGTTTTTTGSMTTTTGAQMTTSGGMTTTGASMTSSSSGMIMCDPTTVTNIPQTDCDLLQQDCDGNLTCVPVGDASNVVVGTECGSNGGLKTPGESCFDNPECEKGSYCIGVNETTGAPGFCTRICCPEMNQGCGFGSCDINVTFDGAGHFAMMCSYSPSCMLLQPNQCDANSDCHPGNDGLATCSFPSPNPVGPGQVCMAPNDCGDMQDCVKLNNEPDFTCHYVCKLGDVTSQPGLGGCPGGTTCKNISGFGFPGLGLCGI